MPKRGARSKQAAKLVVRDNLARIMATKPEWSSSVKLGRLAGLNQKSVNNLVAARFDPQLGSLERLAHAIGIEVWEILLPGLDQGLRDLVRAYTATDSEGRRLIDFAVEAVKRRLEESRHPTDAAREKR